MVDKRIILEEILNEPLALLSNITHGGENSDSYLKSMNVMVTPTNEFNSYSLCKELIKNGFGVGIGNQIHYLDYNDFFILDTDFNLPERTFDMGYIKTSKNKLINEFINLTENY